LAMERRRAREAALLVLFQEEAGTSPSSGWELACEITGVGGEGLDFARRLVREVRQRKKDLDALVQSLSEGWPLHRMAPVVRNALRIGTCELLHMRETPMPVIINEAVELTKKYADGASAKFVNGILARVAELRHSPAEGGR